MLNWYRIAFTTLALGLTAGCAADAGPEEDDKEDDGTVPAESAIGVDGAEDTTDEGNGEVVGTTSSAYESAADCVRLQEYGEKRWFYEKGKGWYRVEVSVAAVTNKCKGRKRLKLIWKWAKDGRCVDLPVGRRYEETRSRPGRPDPTISQVRRC